MQSLVFQNKRANYMDHGLGFVKGGKFRAHSLAGSRPEVGGCRFKFECCTI